jgi:radical SAM superfamily enzyme YgiQ (UPF0313 family)
MKKKLLLINPVNKSGKNMALIAGSKYPPIGLGIIAALTPENWDVEIIDENQSEFYFKPADLVALTAFTANVNRAYDIAAQYRKRNIHTVIGGIHASMLPDEAINYVDTVVTGEAEPIWQTVIADFEKGQIKRLYKSELHSLTNLPKPRRELFHPNYWLSSIQSSRGCPMGCDFCTVSQFNGKRYRFRPVEEVLDELETIKQKVVFFVDDNLFLSDRELQSRSKSLFEGIIKRGIKKEWFTFASIKYAENTELLKLASQSGCKMLFIGIECESEAALKSAGKFLNLKQAKNKYKDAIKKIHSCGIGIIGGIIYGFDTDTPEILEQRTSFLAKSGIDTYHITTYTPFPGTKLMERIANEKRLMFDDFPKDWHRYNWKEYVIKNKSGENEKINHEINKAHSMLYNNTFLRWKFLKTWLATKSLKTAKWAYFTNKYIGQAYK